MNKYLEKHKDTDTALFEIDGYLIIAKDVDEQNRRIYVVEKDGKRSVKLYNEIDQRKIPKSEINEMDMVVTKKTDTGFESKKFKNYGDRPENIKEEIENFLHPEKFLKDNKNN